MRRRSESGPSHDRLPCAVSVYRGSTVLRCAVVSRAHRPGAGRERRRPLLGRTCFGRRAAFSRSFAMLVFLSPTGSAKIVAAVLGGRSALACSSIEVAQVRHEDVNYFYRLWPKRSRELIYVCFVGLFGCDPLAPALAYEPCRPRSCLAEETREASGTACGLPPSRWISGSTRTSSAGRRRRSCCATSAAKSAGAIGSFRLSHAPPRIDVASACALPSRRRGYDSRVSKSSTVSRRRISRAWPSRTRTTAGRGTSL